VNYLVITDGNDTLDDKISYNPNVYMLCLEMSNLHNSWKDYGNNGQILFYDDYHGFRVGHVDSKSSWCNIVPQ
jgi:hypothetical protein